jgi:hypothetical protein
MVPGNTHALGTQAENTFANVKEIFEREKVH